MNIQEIRELIRVKPPELRATDRRLAHCHDIADLRRTARRLIPRPVFDYVDGGSDEELEQRLAAIWRVRDDRYSELRTAETLLEPKIEMSYIGG